MNHSMYTSAHNWMYYWFGNPSVCENGNCNNNCNYYEWANISGKYLKDRIDWLRLCASCHRRMDYKIRNGNYCLKGHEFTKDNIYIWNKSGRRKCRICIRNNNKKYYWKNK